MKIPKLSKKDILSIIIVMFFIILLAIPNFIDKSNCEVARPDYKCATISEVLKENCAYLQTNNYTDQSIIWYVQNLCQLQNKYHNSGFDCSNTIQICEVVL